MNVARTITVVVTYGEIIAALKAAYPASLHIQSLPSVGGQGVAVEATQGKGMIIKSTVNVASEEAPAMKLLTGPRE